MVKPKVSVDSSRSLRVAAAAGGWAWEVSQEKVLAICAANFAEMAAGSGEKALTWSWSHAGTEEAGRRGPMS
eukprot:10865032-Heterocapsa_arctica.AAC.1